MQVGDTALMPVSHRNHLHGVTPVAAPTARPSGQADNQQPLKCPRCDSTNTKFCYYNNYSLSQPRHFCKACKRYWTRGGTLRNVPVGGGCRKNKRIKKPSMATGSSSSSSSHNTLSQIPTTSHINNASSHLNPLLYGSNLQIPHMDTMGIMNDYRSVLSNPIDTLNEFQPQECSLPTSSSLLHDYSLVDSSLLSHTNTRHPKMISSSAWLPLYQGLQAGGGYTGNASLGLSKEIKEEGSFQLQPACDDNQLGSMAADTFPFWSSAISGVWPTEPCTSFFGSSATAPLI